MSLLLAATHEICGAACCPDSRMSSTVSRVPCCVEPPAPNVTEKNRGFSCASSSHVARSFALPSSVFGGNNSKLNVPDADDSVVMFWRAMEDISAVRCDRQSIPVMIRLVRTSLVDTDIGCLRIGQLRQLRVQLLQLQARHFFVQMFRQRIN